jgi:uncharacterized protein (DUF433 family)
MGQLDLCYTGIMSETPIDYSAVVTKLNILEKELRQVRELVQSQAVYSVYSPVENPYIERVPDILRGEPVIKGTRTPVRAIVEHWKFGDSPEEIARKLPHLRLAQIFAALGYYDDHRDEIEAYITRNRVPVND